MKKNIKLIGKKAKIAIQKKIDTKTKNKVLKSFALLLKKEEKKILLENRKDIIFAKQKKIRLNLVERLILNSKKLKSIKK